MKKLLFISAVALLTATLSQAQTYFISTIAGTGTGGYNGDGIAATVAELNEPTGIVTDVSGNVYIADANNVRVRIVNTGGIISTIAGDGSGGYSGDNGPATAAELAQPNGVAKDASGNLYIADFFNNRIRMVNTSGTITTFAGNGYTIGGGGPNAGGYSGDTGPATAAELNNPTGVAVDASGNVYIADRQNNRIRMVNTSGTITTFAGNGVGSYSGDTGPATAAELWHPQGVAVDGSGNVYIADLINMRIRRVNTGGTISTVAGNGYGAGNVGSYSGDGGAATAAELYDPSGVAVDASGNLFIADNLNYRIRRVNTIGIISTIAGNGTYGFVDDVAATAGELYNPNGVAVDASGNIYIADVFNNCVRQLTPDCTLSEALPVVNQNVSCTGGNNGMATAAAPSAGASPYTYSWSGGLGTNTTISNVSAGTYTLTIMDNNGCSATVSAIISQPAYTLTAGISSVTNVLCNGSSTGSATATLNQIITQSFSYTGTVQHYTVPAGITTVTVSIAGAAGAAGGGINGGAGASFAGICSVSPGQILSVVAGGAGLSGIPVGSPGEGGGGGASWVYDSSIVLYNPSGTSGLLAVAGGGGGSGWNGNPGAPGGTDLIANASTASSGSEAGGTNGNGGTAAENIDGSAPGSGGAGWLSNGANVANGSGQPATGGNDEANNFLITYTPGGGYGGGGGHGYDGGCGGGGYNGGGGGGDVGEAGYGGGGGGSYLNGTVIGTPVTTNTGNGSAGISYTALGGTSPYTYSWSGGGGTNLTATGLSAGTYTLTIMDNNGCSVTVSAIISQPAYTLTAGISSVTNVLCNGSSTGSATATLNQIITQSFSYTGTVQHYTVPAGITTVTVSIAGAAGAAGGGINGGAGASFAGICSVSPGQILSVVAGGAGLSGIPVGSPGEGGGGGASWVYDSSIVLYNPSGTSGLLAVAGGGGGSGWNGNPGAPGGTDLIANASTASSGSEAGGTNGNGGTAAENIDGSAPGSGGAGWLSNGANVANGSGQPATGGNDEANNFLITYTPGGGYGGGGGHGYDGGCGGGGYNGGGGGGDVGEAGYGGGGGGSYLNGTVIGTPVTTNTGNGSAGISYTALGGTSPYTYSWSGGGGTNVTATGLSAGTYTLTVTDNNNCSTTVSATITQPSAIANTYFINTIAGNGTGGYNADNIAATSAEVYLPTGVAVDGSGNVYIADIGNNRIRKVNTNGVITTVAGNGTPSYSGDGGAATSAELFSPWGVVLDGSGNMYISDYGNARIRKVSTSGIITTIAGNGTQGYTGDNIAATSAGVLYPEGLAVDGSGNVYVAEFGDGRIRKVGTNGIITTIAGNGSIGETGDGGAATAAEMENAADVKLDISGNLYIADQHVIRMVNTNGIITTMAGNGSSGYNGDNISATAAELNGPTGVVVDGSGNVYIGDQHNNRIRLVNTSGIISTIAGNGYSMIGGGTGGFSGDGGAATAAELNTPTGVAVDGSGNVYFADLENSRIRKLTAPVITIPSSCHEANGRATAEGIVGGTSPYTYSWSGGGGTNLTATGLSAGTYVLTITDNNGCTGTATATITQSGNMNVTFSVVTKISCNGYDNGSINAVVSGGNAPYTYSWTNGQTTATASGLSAGTYTVTVNDNSGCSASAWVGIGQPTLLSANALETANISCNGNSNGQAKVTVTGGYSPYTYSWSPNNSSTYIASGLSAGTYTVSLQDRNGCNASSIVTITQPAALRDSVSSIMVPTCSVAGTATIGIIGGTSPYRYIWSPNVSTSATATGLTARSYTVQVKDAEGCYEDVVFTITQANGLTATALVTGNISCNGSLNGQAKVSATGGASPYTYSWSPNNNSTYISTGLSAGTYSVSVTDKNGCNSIASVTVTQPSILRDSVASITYPTIHGGTGSATIGATGGTSPYRYTWTPNVSTTATGTGLTARTYTVQVKDANGCYNNVIFVITQPATSVLAGKPVHKNSLTGGADSLNQCCPDNINLYPNPNSGQFTITGISAGMLIEVYDYTGRKISLINAAGQTMKLNISNEPNGVYLIRIIDKDGNLVSQKKVVKVQ